MKSVIVGTAGHIDHGKTALVKALTGIDADRLEEEKRRGITIDLGFAHLDLPLPEGETLRLGFVDVPGHERFVRNMLAGAGGIDLVLLVIAADDSIKPQTREHLDICRLLGVRRGITVVTKSDLASRETLDVVRLEIDEFLRRSFLENAPVVEVSSLTGAGMPELKQVLVQAAQGVQTKDASALARLPIDRAFTMKGFGTVVTGTLVSGTIREGDEMEVFPSGRRTRIRSVQVHGEPTALAIAGQRTALNLAGIDKEELRRGMTLSPPSTLQSTKRAEVSLTLLPSAKPLKDRAKVHLHTYTAETVATIVLHEKKQISAGEEADAQLRLAEPTLLLPGDRFVIRQFSPVVTIGGGVILDASTPQRGMSKAASEEFLKVMRQAGLEPVLLARIARRGKMGLTQSQAVSETGWPPGVVAATAQTLRERGQIVRTSGPDISAQTMQEICAQTIAAVTVFQQKNPLVAGIPREELREQIGLTPEVLSAVIETLIANKQLEASGEQVHLPGRGVVLKDEEAESKAIIEKAFASSGLKTPALKEVLAGLKVDAMRAQKIVTLLLRDKILVKISDDLVFHQSALQGLRQQMAAQKTKSPRMDVARFKDLTGVTRKYAIPLLEYLDRERVTRRVGNERLIL